MAEEELQVVRLRNDFYRDGFNKVLFTLLLVLVAIVLLIVMSFYLHLSKPSPVVFSSGKEFRVLPSIPVDQAYLNQADLIQWVSFAFPSAFTYDFLNYNDQLKKASRYFTAAGWKKFLDVLNIYANYDSIIHSKLFITAHAAGAPYILNQGLLEGRFAWWVQMPISVSYSSYNIGTTKLINFQILVVRIPTDDDLDGVSIDNIIVQQPKSDNKQVRSNG